MKYTIRFILVFVLFVLLAWALLACDDSIVPLPQQFANPSFVGMDPWQETDFTTTDAYSPWHALSDSSVHAWGGFADSKYLVQPGAWAPACYVISVTCTNYTDRDLVLRYVGLNGHDVVKLDSIVIRAGDGTETRRKLAGSVVNLRARYEAFGIQVSFKDGKEGILSFNLADIDMLCRGEIK